MSDSPNRLHNRPPIEDTFRMANEELPDHLAESCASEIERANTIVGNLGKIPDVIANEEDEAKATDMLSQAKKHVKLLDSRRKGINAGPTTAKDIIDGFFRTKGMDPIEKAIDRVSPAMERFKREKAEKERRAREEAERLAREEAERKRQEAAEAERKRQQAEEDRRRAERDAAAAEERKRKAIEEARLAEERKRKAEEDAKQAERRQKEAEERRLQEEAKAAEATRKRDREAAERRAKDAAEAEERERLSAEAARQRAATEEARKQQERQTAEDERGRQATARDEVVASREQLSGATRDARTATALAASADRDADKAQTRAEATQAELTRSRGDRGGFSQLKTRWVGRPIDGFSNLPQKTRNELWAFLTDDDIQKALNSYTSVHEGNRPLVGIKFYEDDKMAVR